MAILQLILIPVKIPLLIIKGIILLILMIITELFRVCTTLGALTLFSCPEASVSFVNMYSAF